MMFNLVYTELFGENVKHICIFYHFSTLRWHRQFKHLLMEDKMYLAYTVNVIAADALAPCVTRASTVMVLT